VNRRPVAGSVRWWCSISVRVLFVVVVVVVVFEVERRGLLCDPIGPGCAP